MMTQNPTTRPRSMHLRGLVEKTEGDMSQAYDLPVRPVARHPKRVAEESNVGTVRWPGWNGRGGEIER